MTDNVIILGAGASHDAGIPLLAGFVDKMWEYAIRGRNGDQPLSAKDHDVFKRAIEVRNELNAYHGRATFDDRNIEDILSILSFNVIGGGRPDKAKLDRIIKAMARTIELSCNVEHDGRLNVIEESGPGVYRSFWRNMFGWAGAGNDLPAIITLNYDLVLERSLFQLLIGKTYGTYESVFPFPGISVKYYFDLRSDTSFRVQRARYQGPDFESIPGTKLEPVSSGEIEGAANIEILKLHGSLNFPSKRGTTDGYQLTTPRDDPYMLPPIFNKLTTTEPREMWKVALERLRQAKNIIIVGYSLPATDIYMQYFLKTAVGPNLDLNRVYVFDPVLFEGGERAQSMVDRYLSCFAPQMRNRIDFFPGSRGSEATVSMARGTGTLQHFVQLIGQDAGSIFF